MTAEAMLWLQELDVASFVAISYFFRFMVFWSPFTLWSFCLEPIQIFLNPDHCQASLSGITQIYMKQPCLPAMLHQLNSQQLSWSVKSCQLCGTEKRWWTEQLSVGITRIVRLVRLVRLVKIYLELPHSQTARARDPKFLKNVHLPLSVVSHVRCHMSGVTCHLYLFFLFFFFFFYNWWSQSVEGLPRLVSISGSFTVHGSFN